MHLREHATKGILQAYTGSEQQSYRPPTTMKMRCGEHIVTINPYVWSKRRKTYADQCREYDQKVDKLTAQINSVYLMSSDDDIEKVCWSYEDMFAVIRLSDDA